MAAAAEAGMSVTDSWRWITTTFSCDHVSYFSNSAAAAAGGAGSGTDSGAAGDAYAYDHANTSGSVCDILFCNRINESFEAG